LRHVKMLFGSRNSCSACRSASSLLALLARVLAAGITPHHVRHLSGASLLTRITLQVRHHFLVTSACQPSLDHVSSSHFLPLAQPCPLLCPSYSYTCTYTYINYIHTEIHSYIHIYIRIYIHTYIHRRKALSAVSWGVCYIIV